MKKNTIKNSIYRYIYKFIQTRLSNWDHLVESQGADKKDTH